MRAEAKRIDKKKNEADLQERVKKYKQCNPHVGDKEATELAKKDMAKTNINVNSILQPGNSDRK